MQISSAQLNMSASHIKASARSETLSVERFGRSDGPGRPEGHNARVHTPAAPPGAAKRADHPHHVMEADGTADESGLDPQLRLLKTIIEGLTGRLLELFDPGELQAEPSAAPARTASANPPVPAGGMRITHSSDYAEFEAMLFRASGEIRTRDGQTINFAVELEMQRSFVEQHRSQVSWGDVPELKDPLVINFDGQAAQLSADRYSFDIDTDGELDNIAGLAPGRAFLVLDHNGNGRIDDGSEVIGALSGDAFAELKAMDADGNGFVDGGDTAYAELGTWRPGDDGIASLQTAGVAALATDSLATPMQLDADGAAAGQLRRTSIYVSDAGTVGTTQQIDLLT